MRCFESVELPFPFFFFFHRDRTTLDGPFKERLVTKGGGLPISDPSPWNLKIYDICGYVGGGTRSRYPTKLRGYLGDVSKHRLC